MNVVPSGLVTVHCAVVLYSPFLHSFSVNGVDYSIDLKDKNTTEFHRKLDYYIQHAERVGGRKRKPAAPKPSAVSESAPTTKRDPGQTRAIREWANANGYTVNSRGRIPAKSSRPTTPRTDHDECADRAGARGPVNGRSTPR